MECHRKRKINPTGEIRKGFAEEISFLWSLEAK